MSKLAEIRKQHKFSNQYMANELKISKPFYWQLEHQQRRLSYDMAFKIAKIFDLRPDDIFYEEFEKKTIQ